MRKPVAPLFTGSLKALQRLQRPLLRPVDFRPGNPITFAGDICQEVSGVKLNSHLNLSSNKVTRIASTITQNRQDRPSGLSSAESALRPVNLPSTSRLAGEILKEIAVRISGCRIPYSDSALWKTKAGAHVENMVTLGAKQTVRSDHALENLHLGAPLGFASGHGRRRRRGVGPRHTARPESRQRGDRSRGSATAERRCVAVSIAGPYREPLEGCQHRGQRIRYRIHRSAD